MPNMMRVSIGSPIARGESCPAWLGTTKPIKQAQSKQGRNDQKRGCIGKSLKEPNSEQGEDDMDATAKPGPINGDERDAHKDEHRAKILYKHQSHVR